MRLPLVVSRCCFRLSLIVQPDPLLAHSDAASSRPSDEFKDLIRELTTEFKKLTEKVENLERTQ